MRLHRSTWAVAGLALWLLPQGAAHGTESAASLYLPGLKGPLAGFVPPPGFSFENDFYSYSGRISASALPSPAGKPFSLTFRTYVPRDVVKRGEWQPAPVTKLSNSPTATEGSLL